MTDEQPPAGLACPPADPTPRPPSFRPPPGSIDTHFHIFADPERYPFTSDRSYTPPQASLEAFLHLQATLGIDRGVLVHPSVYGTDNRLLLDVLRQLGPRLRGVAVVDEGVSDAELEELNAAGVRGVRLNLLYRGGVSLEAARRLAKRIAEFDWHLQLLIDVSSFPDLGQEMRRLGVPVVFDHFGHLPVAKGVSDPGFQEMLSLLKDGLAWVKLSGAYRITAERNPPYEDVRPFARAVLETAPNRAVWGSDWPHPAVNRPMPNDGDLLDMLADWASDPVVRAAVLRDNPAILYGFPTSRGE
jgi:predicted TIM-barrel fold metal-dependent hydrolase